MKRFVKQLLYLGIKDKHPKYLSSKIYLANILALSIAFGIVVPYIGITFFLFKPLVFIPVICTLLLLSTLALNYFGLINFSRLVLGILPMCLPLTYFAYIMPPGSPKYFEMYIISLSFSIVPFIVFDIRERIYLIISSVIIIIVFVFGLDWLNEVLIMDIDYSIITDGPLGTVNLIMGTILIIAGVLILSNQNYISEKHTSKLIQEMNEQSEAVKNSENELTEKIAEIEKNQEKERKRNWATEGIAQVSTILRSEQDGDKLYDHITSYLTEYLDANQCALFLVESDEYGEEVVLKLQSCYAYDRKKFIEKEITPGVGLVGQVYLEKSSLYMKDVPNGYTKITSGLGESTPNQVLIVPLIVNEEVGGVFEFASFTGFEDYQIQFLEHLGETLASFINVNRINQRTKILLHESQQQAEEMRSQEEEMRQNMEELSATQEEMARKEQEYLNQIEDLKKELETLNTDPSK